MATEANERKLLDMNKSDTVEIHTVLIETAPDGASLYVEGPLLYIREKGGFIIKDGDSLSDQLNFARAMSRFDVKKIPERARIYHRLPK